MPIWLLIILIVVGSLVVILLPGFFVATHVVFKEAFYNDQKGDLNKSSFLSGPQYEPYKEWIQRNLDEAGKVEPYEEVCVTSFDGLKLYGRVYRFNDSKNVQIQCHGYKGSGRRDMCRFLLNAKDNGLNVIVVDQRGHGRSDGNIVTYGVNERKDLLKWIDLAKEKFGEDCKIILAGLSMGAATVTMSLDQNLPDNVKGVYADCPFSAPKDEILKVALEEKTKLPKPAALLMIKNAAKIWGHFNLFESSAVESVKKTNIPVLLIHGEADTFVPFEFSQKIAAANPEMVDLQSFPNAGHALCYFTDNKRYLQIVSEFYKKCLKEQD